MGFKFNPINLSGFNIVDGNTGGGGTVTSVGLSLPSIFAVTGSPVTSSGTLTGNFNTQLANAILSGPTAGPAAAPAFRSLVAADIPSLSAAKITGGDPNTVAFFNSGGVLTDDTNFRYNQTIDSLGFASITSGTLTPSGSGAFAHGALDGSGIITASNNGSSAHGNVNAAVISAGGAGSSAHGHSLTANATISASGLGTKAFGFAENNSTISSQNNGTLAFGFAQNTATISATGQGGFAFGTSTGNTSIITSTGKGALAAGFNSNASAKIQSLADGCLAFGATDDSCQINASSSGGARRGSVAMGYAAKPAAVNALISADEAGAFARGFANGRTISATGKGSIASGYANAGNITVSGDGAIAHGEQMDSTAAYSAAFGIGHTVSTYGSIVAGRFASAPGTAASWVATEPLLVLGNGTAVGAEATAYKVDKDGRQTTTASNVDTSVTLISAATVLSARTNRTVIADLNGASGNITLPAGENGLEYRLATFGAGVAAYTLVANGGDTFDVGVSTTLNTASPFETIIFKTGVWYRIA